MSVFDVYVKKMAEYVDGMRRSQRQVREIYRPPGDTGLLQGLPIRIGAGAQPGVILKEDTGVELGRPENGSCAFVLWTKDLNLIRDGRITLVGPDINESPGKSLPFGQVLILGGDELKEEHQMMLEGGQYISDRIEGYMIRTVPHRLWSRVSRKAVEKGFCFQTLGRALMGIIRSELSLIEASEILFVTSGKEDIDELEIIASQVEKIAREIRRGIFSLEDDDTCVCTSGIDCRVCPDQIACDNIREVINLRKPDIRNE